MDKADAAAVSEGVTLGLSAGMGAMHGLAQLCDELQGILPDGARERILKSAISRIQAADLPVSTKTLLQAETSKAFGCL